MRILYSVLAIALLAGCGAKKNNSKDPLDPNNFDDSKDKKTEQTDKTDDSGWSSKDRKQAISDCVDFVTERAHMSASEAKDGCSCTVDKIQGDMSFDDFEAIYQKEERPTSGSKAQKNYDRLDEAATGCIKKNNMQTNDDDIKPKKHKSDDDE